VLKELSPGSYKKKGVQPLVRVDEVKEVMNIIDAIFQSAEQNCIVYF